ncbi:MAG: Fic family protein [Acidimicrobiaceae bacterium]|nr:Fic family protein [Acidimicrobiaceae bacterium]
MKRPMPPPDIAEFLAEVAEENPQRLVEVFSKGRPVDEKGRYPHWDQMRHRQPPEGLTLNEWWVSTAASRANNARMLPFTGTDGEPFRFTNIDRIQEMVHRIDQQASGRLQSDEAVAAVGSSGQYLVSSLVEEAIASSLLEGAATTRRVAKELLRTGRQPRDRSERMVLNNFLAMESAEELASSGAPLTSDHVLELHRIVTDGTLDNESEAGRLRRPDERIEIVWRSDGQVLHRPPPADELPSRLEHLCGFANGDTGEGFLHPVVRAALIHFWVGYDHPFVDGNGRTARVLFYWSMLRAGYWLAQYLSISTILRKAPAKYARSYLYTETDSNDTTYFVVYQLEVLRRAIADLRQYFARKSTEIARVERAMRGVPGLNHRQLAILSNALRDPDAYFTFAGQKRLHRVAYQSARTDLLGLEALGLLKKAQVGRTFEFWPVDGLEGRISGLSDSKTTTEYYEAPRIGG